MKNILTASLMLLVMTMSVMAQEKFCIAKNGNTAAIVVDEQDWKGVARAANDLGDDVRKVCGTACSVVSAMSTDKPNIVVGTIGKSSIINKFIKQKKLDVNKVKGQWESFVIDVVDGNQIDSQPMQTIDARRGIVDTFSEYNPQNIARSKVLKPLPPRSRLALSGFWQGHQLPRRDEVFDNLRWLDTTFEGITPGHHKLKLIMIDPEIVVEQIVVNPDNNHYSYFGR